MLLAKDCLLCQVEPHHPRGIARVRLPTLHPSRQDYSYQKAKGEGREHDLQTYGNALDMGGCQVS
jgi:hypothetical protein